MDNKDSKQPYEKYAKMYLSMSIEEVADAIIEITNLGDAIQVLKQVQADANMYANVKSMLFSIFSIGENSDYYSKRNLDLTRLKILEYLVSQETIIDQVIFKVTTIYHLIAICKGYLANQLLPSDKMSKIKQGFMRNVKKDVVFWELSSLENLSLNLVDKSTGYRPLYSSVQHAIQIDKIQYLFSFYQENTTFFPGNIGFWNFIFKYLLCFRLQSQKEKLIFNRIIQKYFKYDHHIQITRQNFKFAIQFFRNSYNQKQCLYSPQRSIMTIFSRYKVYEIDQIFLVGSIGLYWSQDDITSSIVNCIKLGVTDNCCKILISFITLATNQRKYQQLIYAFQSNTSKIFVFLKHKNLFKNSIKIMRYFLLSPFPTLSLYEKFVEKAIPLIPVLDSSNIKEFIDFLQVVAFAYKEVTSIQSLNNSIVSNLEYVQLSEEELKRQLIEFAWKIQPIKKTESSSKQPENKEYKGLINIGNSCYMNSFIQALFMNKEFRRQLLKVSTLSLQQQSLKKANLNEETTAKEKEATCKRIRESIRPLAQLQRLFSLLLRSKRPQISPASIKSVSAPQFRNNFQQDSIQYGHSLLDQISRSSFTNFFQGEMTIEIICPNCHSIRNKKQAFIDLIISTEKDEQSIEQMISKSFQEEAVDNLTCDLCMIKTQKSIKKHFISKYPNYLILSIKRFMYSVEQKRNKKITTKINFTSTLKLNEIQYELYSIIIHRGPSANSGHYYTFSKQKTKKSSQIDSQSTWVCHNDSQVMTFINFQKVYAYLETNLQDTPYIFFFERKEHIESIRKDLDEPIILRKPLQSYIEKDNIEYFKSLQKSIPIQFNLKLNYPFKKDDDEEDEEPHQQINHFNSFIS